MSEIFEVAGIAGRLVTAPPVYDPGGQVCFVADLPSPLGASALTALENEAKIRGAVLMVIPCETDSRTTESAKEKGLEAAGYAPASAWYRGAIARAAQTTPDAGGAEIRTATAADVPRFLEIGETKRRLYETFSPVFWRVAATPKEEFAPYVTGQIESPDNIALTAERDGVIVGYCLAQKAGEPGGMYLDDFTVERQEDWPTIGAALLAEMARRAAQRGFASFVIVCGNADAPKRAAFESLGFSIYQNWWVKPL